MPAENSTGGEVWRRPHISLVVPTDLAGRLHRVLREAYDQSEVQVVLDRRTGGADRRQASGDAPDGVERRQGDRRLAAGRTAKELGMELPYSARRYADRILVVEDLVPVHQRDQGIDRADLVERVRQGEAGALDELDRRVQPAIHGSMVQTHPGRKVHEAVRTAADEVLRRAQDPASETDVERWISDAIHHN